MSKTLDINPNNVTSDHSTPNFPVKSQRQTYIDNILEEHQHMFKYTACFCLPIPCHRSTSHISI